MAYPIESQLVIAVASSALFDLREADGVFRTRGSETYREYTLQNERNPLSKGPAFAFIRRLLALNDDGEAFDPIEVVLISKNDADTGNRVLLSAAHYGLPITRSAFTSGNLPHPYISALNACLFLSTNDSDVRAAVAAGKPAGRILFPAASDEQEIDEERELKIAFDFDGILADDSSEKIYQTEGLSRFQSHELENASIPLPPGPLQPLLQKISELQKSEMQKQSSDPGYKPRIRTAIVSARGAPAHERIVFTLRHWGIQVNEAFFLGGVDKGRILEVFRPHIFFDDQEDNLPPAGFSMAMVHVPYGNLNRRE